VSYHGDCELNIIDKEPIGAGKPEASAGTAVRAPGALGPGHLGRWRRGPPGGQTIDAAAARGLDSHSRSLRLACLYDSSSSTHYCGILIQIGAPETWPTNIIAGAGPRRFTFPRHFVNAGPGAADGGGSFSRTEGETLGRGLRPISTRLKILA
jgi:hypothetical protein